MFKREKRYLELVIEGKVYFGRSHYDFTPEWRVKLEPYLTHNMKTSYRGPRGYELNRLGINEEIYEEICKLRNEISCEPLYAETKEEVLHKTEAYIEAVRELSAFEMEIVEFGSLRIEEK